MFVIQWSNILPYDSQQQSREQNLENMPKVIKSSITHLALELKWAETISVKNWEKKLGTYIIQGVLKIFTLWYIAHLQTEKRI